MILGTKARYAVMAMVDLATMRDERPVKLSSIADRQEIPLAYLEQIFSRLRQQGLVKSVKGPGGGYRLSRGSADITVGEVVEAVKESLKMTRCEAHVNGGCMANKARCLTHDLWQGLEDKIGSYLSAITLADVCASGKKFAPAPAAPSGGFVAAVIQ